MTQSSLLCPVRGVQSKVRGEVCLSSLSTFPCPYPRLPPSIGLRRKDRDRQFSTGSLLSLGHCCWSSLWCWVETHPWPLSPLGSLERLSCTFGLAASLLSCKHLFAWCFSSSQEACTPRPYLLQAWQHKWDSVSILSRAWTGLYSRDTLPTSCTPCHLSPGLLSPLLGWGDHWDVVINSPLPQLHAPKKTRSSWFCCKGTCRQFMGEELFLWS